ALHDGSRLMLHKIDGSHDPRDADAALVMIRKSAAQGIVATGLLYIDEEQRDLHDALETTARPLNSLPMSELCPGSKRLEDINRPSGVTRRRRSGLPPNIQAPPPPRVRGGETHPPPPPPPGGARNTPTSRHKQSAGEGAFCQDWRGGVSGVVIESAGSTPTE